MAELTIDSVAGMDGVNQEALGKLIQALNAIIQTTLDMAATQVPQPAPFQHQRSQKIQHTRLLRKNRMPTWMHLAPIGNPESRDCIPLDACNFLHTTVPQLQNSVRNRYEYNENIQILSFICISNFQIILDKELPCVRNFPCICCNRLYS